MKKREVSEGVAPGRLDVMGGIADYSGSLVLQMPIRQRTTVQVALRHDRQCLLTSRNSDDVYNASFSYDKLLNDGKVDFAYARKQFAENPGSGWAAYVIGCVLAVHRYKDIDFQGAEFVVHSDVPLGKGVSSSASLEVATLKALARAFDLTFEGTELPRLAQRVENEIVGAPCGLMDQLASCFGEPDKLLPILCQPDIVQPHIPIPKGLHLVGIDSGVRHSVGGASYSDVRCAAFMGYSMIAQSLGTPGASLAKAKEDDDLSALPFGGYLCNISVAQFENDFARILPEMITGSDFLKRYGVTTDRHTVVDPARTYAVRVCTAHPVYEHERVKQFREWLHSLNEHPGSPDRTDVTGKLGELMYASHDSYSRCGLGSDRTDEIVRLVRMGQAGGLRGAKITGGGSGGTVCVLADGEEGLQAVRRIHETLMARYGSLAIFA